MTFLLKEIGTAIFSVSILFFGLLTILWFTELYFIFLPQIIAIILLPSIGVSQFKLIDFACHKLAYSIWMRRTWTTGALSIFFCLVFSIANIYLYKDFNNFNMPNWVFITFYVFCLMEIPYQISECQKHLKANKRVFKDMVAQGYYYS
jgi:vacuolar-type H+-ATPase subunit I/STV1